MPASINLQHPLPSRRSPRHKHHAAGAACSYEIDHALRETLPAAVGVAVGLVGADGQAGVEHQHAVFGPGGEEAAAVRGRSEGGVVVLEGFVHVFEGGRGWGRGAHGEGEAVGLVVVVVGVLT